MADKMSHNDLLVLTSEITSAYMANNAVGMEEIPAVIQKVYRTLSHLGGDHHIHIPPTVARPQPAVKIDKSVTDDYIVCLEDGKKLKMLKRHLMTAYGMSPEEYRERWGLPFDYPMTAPKYAEQRSNLAKTTGLGKTSPTGKKAKRG